LSRAGFLYGEWIGTLDGRVNAEIKAQVSGCLLSQHYIEGSFGKKGQLLFEIDPRLSPGRARSGPRETGRG
jgi:hypothetical protein